MKLYSSPIYELRVYTNPRTAYRKHLALKAECIDIPFNFLKEFSMSKTD